MAEDFTKPRLTFSVCMCQGYVKSNLFLKPMNRFPQIILISMVLPPQEKVTFNEEKVTMIFMKPFNL